MIKSGVESAGFDSRDQLTAAVRKFGANKSLGQNFLVDLCTLNLIVSTLELSKDEPVLEVGPGLGFLTELLAAAGANVLAVELDMRCVRYLNELKLQNTRIVHADALRFEVDPKLWTSAPADHELALVSSPTSPNAGNYSARTCLTNANPPKVKVVGNIPYQITAPILVHLLGEIGSPAPWLKSLERIVMTIQREVAQRLTARAGSKEYGQITLLVNYFVHVEIVAEVPADQFYPPPEVNSSIVKMIPRTKPAVDCKNPKILRAIIKSGFSKRRKMLKNNLSALFGEDDCTQAFERVNLDPLSRAESLSLSQYAQLADEFAGVSR